MNRVGIIALGEGIYEMEAVMNAFFEPNTAVSLSNNDNLKDTSGPENMDITTWLTSNALAKNKNAKLVLSLAKIKPEALDNNFIHGHVDFENGQVNSQLNYFFQEALIEDINLLFKKIRRKQISNLILLVKI